MSNTPSEERKSEIAELLKGKLEPGEEFYVFAKEKEDVEVKEADHDVLLAHHSPIKKINEEFYGRLLQLDERLSREDSLLSSISLIAGFGICLGIHLSWINEIFGLPIQKFQSFWLYIFVFVVVFTVNDFIDRIFEKQAYLLNRDEILDVVQRSEFSFLRLLAIMEGDPSIQNLYKRLKKDRNFEQEF